MEANSLRIAAVLLRGRDDVLLLQKDNGAHYLPWIHADEDVSVSEALEKELLSLGWTGKLEGYLGSFTDILGRGSEDEREITTLYYLFSVAKNSGEEDECCRWFDRDKGRGITHRGDSLHLSRAGKR